MKNLKTIKKIILLLSILVGIVILNSCSTIEMDDPRAYIVELALHEYNVECIIGKGSCKPEDIQSSNDGFWIRISDTDLSYEVRYDGEFVSEGDMVRTREVGENTEILVPITDGICSIMPKTISLNLISNEKLYKKIEISLIKK